MWHLWIVIAPLLPVALALVALSTTVGRILTATLAAVGQAVAIAAAADDEDPTSLAFTVAFLPFYATVAVIGTAVVERVVVALAGEAAPGPASFGDRLAALLVDVTAVGLVAWRMAESWDGSLQVAGPVVVGLGYLTLGYATGGTLGHRALRLRLVRAASHRPLRADLAFVRAVFVFGEVAAALTFVGCFVAVADLAAMSESDGRSLGDRLVRSRVVRHAEPD